MAPILRSLDRVPDEVLRDLPLPPREGVELFVVTADGAWGDDAYAVGEVLVCRGEARSGDTVVLVARGFGQPRLGTLDGARFYGDAGEPCHPGRWRAAGPVVARVRRESAGWVIHLVDRLGGRADVAAWRASPATEGDPVTPTALCAAAGGRTEPHLARPPHAGVRARPLEAVAQLTLFPCVSVAARGTQGPDYTNQTSVTTTYKGPSTRSAQPQYAKKLGIG